uniref:HECT and RLD domain containing E3 ubiquitin protein ligase 5 n=1 Tax=Microcebus murinus TaxID=30608 RepID=A0A8C5W0D1_MICMU
MIAGGNQSILLWMDKENSYVNLRRKIPMLNEGTVKRWIADVETKQWQSTKRDIQDIFSSPACLTGSFVRKRRAAEMMSIHLDLNKARNIFKELTQKDWISNMITICLRDNLLKNLTFHSPHQEALAVFFLLPECPVMHEGNNWEILVVLFAEAVCKLSDQSSWVLEEYWATLQESAFGKLVQMFKSALVSELHYWAGSAENSCHVKALLEMLKKLHRVNQTRCQLHFPFIFNTLSKTKLLYSDSFLKKEKKIRAYLRLAEIIEQRGSEIVPFLWPAFTLAVRRSHLIEDVLEQLSQSENEDLRKELWVSFRGETELELGSRRRRFSFFGVFQEMTRPEYGMFSYPEEASYMWFPCQGTSPLFFEKRYFFFGVCKLLAIHPLRLKISPVLGVSTYVPERTLVTILQTLLDDEGDDFGEVFYIHFNVHWDRNDVDLIPNGSCIIVDQTNKRDYVSKCVDYIFNISVKPVYDEFERGFYKVCDKEIIEFFHPEQLKDVVVGNTDYDWETFEKNAQYEQDYDSSHPTIVMFWKALHKLTLEEKKKFLVFLTGTDRVQIKGLKNMKITFRCPENLTEKDPMRTYTCTSVLCLPKYSTMERVEEALQVAINNNRGFG